ncbi:hypothetical protein [Brevundimonas sp.]|uniref:hypothetical protein n=1 Tax=Brevundimonas sp. TaxID=1871086 RepID=UPI0035B3EA2E
MKLLRLVVVAAVLAYAGWLAWPWVAPLLGTGAPAGAEAMRSSAESGAPLFGVLPWWSLLAAAVGLYVIAALMLGSGNSKAVVAYFLGFLADAALRLAMDGRAPADLFAAPEATVASAAGETAGLPLDPLWLALGGLLILGLLVMVAGRRIRRKRLPGQFAY